MSLQGFVWLRVHCWCFMAVGMTTVVHIVVFKQPMNSLLKHIFIHRVNTYLRIYPVEA